MYYIAVFFYQTLEFIFIPEHVVSALRNISKRIITWRCHRSVIFPTKEIIDKQEYRVLCTWNIGNAAKHTILLALIYAKYACNRLHLFYHGYTINSIVRLITVNAHIKTLPFMVLMAVKK